MLLALTVPLGARAPAKQAPTPGSSFYLMGPQGGTRDRQFGPLTLDQMQARIDVIVGAKQ